MHLQILHATADLTSPAVPLQHLPMQFVVVRRIESEPRIFDTDIVHDACPATPDKNASYKFLPSPLIRSVPQGLARLARRPCNWCFRPPRSAPMVRSTCLNGGSSQDNHVGGSGLQWPLASQIGYGTFQTSLPSGSSTSGGRKERRKCQTTNRKSLP